MRAFLCKCYKQFKIKTYAEQQQYNSKEHQNITHKNHMIKEFTPLGLRLLGSIYNGFDLSIMLKLHQKCVYNAHMPVKPVSMTSESPKLLPFTIFASNLDKN